MSWEQQTTLYKNLAHELQHTSMWGAWLVLISCFALSVKVKVKVKLYLCLTKYHEDIYCLIKHHAIKKCQRSEGIAPCIPNLSTGWR
jgi:hypothetical protein